MRTLQNQDIFAFGRILKKANLKEDIKKLALDSETNPESFGFDLLFTIFTNCSDSQVEDEVYSFLASLFETDKETIKQGDPIDTIEKMKEIADWEKWKGFFSSVAKSMK